MTKKEFILDVAETLFAQKGFDATSVRDISKAANINVAMISYYFGSKEKLFEELFRVRMTVGVSYIKKIAANESLTIVQKIDKAIEGYVDRVENNSKFYKVILSEQTTNKNKKIIDFLNQSRSSYVDFFRQLIEEGCRTGVLKNNIDPVFFITTLTGTIMQTLLNKEFYARHYNLDSTNNWNDTIYFDRVRKHIQSITKNILGYE